jgi:uncharacterized protein
MPAHALFRGAAAALVCASVALSCAQPPAATRAPAPIVSAQPAPPPVVSVSPAPIAPPAAPYPVPEPVPGEIPAAKPAPEPHIALLLPVEAQDFRAAADAFVNGFQAAAKVQPQSLQPRIYHTDASAERITKQYVLALEEGARVVVGPMTRNGVSALASSGLVLVPTLALNQPETAATLPSGFYVFGLSTELEAAVVAKQAYNDRFRNAIVVNTPNASGRRTRDGFAAAWRAIGGKIVATAETKGSANLIALRELPAAEADVIFLAGGFEEIRLIRPYLPSQLPVYTTSQINLRAADARRDLDLEGVRFLDMPWILSPGDPRFAAHPSVTGLSEEMLRFYALGADAYRIATALAEGRRSLQFEGLTGDLSVFTDGSVERKLWPAVYRDGFPVLAQ